MIQILNFSNPRELPKSFANLSKTLPDALSVWARIKKLEASRTGFPCIPPVLFAWKNLTDLYLKSVPLIDQLPATIGFLVKLQTLDVRECNLKMLPETIGAMLSLQKIDAKKNQLSESALCNRDSVVHLSLENVDGHVSCVSVCFSQTMITVTTN